MNQCSKVCICGNKPNQTKIGGAIFVWLFLLLDAGQLFHNLFIKLSYAIRIEGSIQISIRSPIRLLLMQMDFDR